MVITEKKAKLLRPFSEKTEVFLASHAFIESIFDQLHFSWLAGCDGWHGCWLRRLAVPSSS